MVLWGVLEYSSGMKGVLRGVLSDCMGVSNVMNYGVVGGVVEITGFKGVAG